MEEVWLPVPYRDFGPYYEISNLGRVRSSRRQKVLSTFVNKHGYVCVTFSVNGYRVGTRVHPLVAKAFVPNVLGLPIINHKDGAKENNAASNLEWCSHAFNAKHAASLGLCAKQKLMPSDAANIRKLQGIVSAREMAVAYGVHVDTIRGIIRGDSQTPFDNDNKALKAAALSKGGAR